MYDAKYVRLYPSDRQRLVDWFNDEAWKHEPSRTGHPSRKGRRAPRRRPM